MPPIHRSIYRAQAKAGQAEAAVAWFQRRAQDLRLGFSPGELMTLSLFRWGVHFLLYWESVEEEAAPELLFGDGSVLLEMWPGGATLQPPSARCFVPMMDIFHCLAPQSVEDWRRKSPIEQVVGRVARLQPEMVSSYIFYHYQLQEEQPGSFDKYGIISIHENLIFFYQEHPFIVEEPRRVGKLATTHTPADWHGTMFPHFKLWEDALAGQEIWREVELVFHLEA
ncbi:MAG: hypothetical protein U0175_21395 [Caldilineaceae bacterium]